MSSRPQALTPTKPSNVYEVSDYIRVAPSKDYVLVRHYRTGHGDGGQIVNEPVSSTEELLTTMIRAFEGRCLHVSNGLRGVFEDARQAQECAEAVAAHHRKKADVVGKDLFITL